MRRLITIAVGIVFVVLVGVISVAAQAQSFEQTTLGALGTVESSSVSAAWSDYDGDGDLDVFVTNPLYVNLLYRNDGELGFTVVEQRLGYLRNTFSAAWGDLNNNGRPELFVGSVSYDPQILASQNGVLFEAGGIDLTARNLRDIALADYDGDGDLDVAAAQRHGSPNLILRNEGNLFFVSPTGVLPGPNNDDGIMPLWGDYDQDGDPDLYFLHTKDQGSGLNRFYQNTGESFVQITEGPLVTLQRRSQSANWIDFDNDLDFDLFFSNFGDNNELYRNDGGTFTRLEDSIVGNDESTSMGSTWADLDNDGDLDLLLAVRNGAERLYINDGSGGFTLQTLSGEDGVFSTAISTPDFDGDGLLDIYVTNGGSSLIERDDVYRNTSASGSWLRVQPVGIQTNRAGIGALIKIMTLVDGEARWQLREMRSMSGRLAQAGPWVHFGLGDAAVVDSVVIAWPSGIEQHLGAVNANQVLIVQESGTVGAETGAPEVEPFGIREVYPNPTERGATFAVSFDREGLVRVEVFDARGRRIRTLLDGRVQPGTLRLNWDGFGIGGRAVAAGTYLVRVTFGTRSDTTRVTLLR